MGVGNAATAAFLIPTARTPMGVEELFARAALLVLSLMAAALMTAMEPPRREEWRIAKNFATAAGERSGDSRGLRVGPGRKRWRFAGDRVAALS